MYLFYYRYKNAMNFLFPSLFQSFFQIYLFELSLKKNIWLGNIVHSLTCHLTYLQVGGDAQYAMLKDNKFRYDSSMVTGQLYSNHRPPIWPFTLDTPPDSTTCNLTPCPTCSYPGLWEIPLIRWYGSNQVACAMPDACTTG